MSENEQFKCKLCGRTVDSQENTCCGQRVAPAGEVQAEKAMEPWKCPVCGAPSDTPMTCCGKRAERNKEFKG